MIQHSDLNKIFFSVLNKPTWQVRVGHGSFLTFEFGQPYLHIREPNPSTQQLNRLITIRGDWHLWVYSCNWEIENNNTVIASSNSERNTMQRAASFLDGQKLLNVAFDNNLKISSFIFDLGGMLKTWPQTTEREDQWIFFHKDEHVITLNSRSELDGTA